MRLFRSVGAMETIAAYHKNQFYMANLFIYLFVCLFFSFHAASIDYKRHKTKLNDYHLYVCNNSGSYKKVIKFCLFGGSTRAFTFYLKKIAYDADFFPALVALFDFDYCHLRQFVDGCVLSAQHFDAKGWFCLHINMHTHISVSWLHLVWLLLLCAP